MKTPNLLRSLCILLCAITLLCANNTLGQDASQAKWLSDQYTSQEVEKITEMTGTIPAQWRVIWTLDPARQATISWSTRQKGRKHIVHYGTQSAKGNLKNYTKRMQAYRNGEYHRAKRDKIRLKRKAFYHHAKIKNLKASTRYYFTIESDGNLSREFYFITAPTDDRQFSILSSGDSRTDHEMRCKMNLMLRYFNANQKDLLALAHGGDYMNQGTLWGDWTAWLSHNELCVAEDGKILPIIPTRGNHDVGPIFNQVFDSPGGKDNYYTTPLGSQVQLLTLNTEISASGNQYTWLKKELEKQRKNANWLLAQYHRPLYPAVKKPAAAKRFWVPLFEKYNLDLALESDGHALKRTVPIRNEKPDPTGVIYIGEGGLGVQQRPARKERWYFQKPGFATSSHHLILVQIKGDDMTSTFFGPKLNKIDTYHYTARGAQKRKLLTQAQNQIKAIDDQISKAKEADKQARIAVIRAKENSAKISEQDKAFEQKTKTLNDQIQASQKAIIEAKKQIEQIKQSQEGAAKQSSAAKDQVKKAQANHQASSKQLADLKAKRTQALKKLDQLKKQK